MRYYIHAHHLLAIGRGSGWLGLLLLFLLGCTSAPAAPVAVPATAESIAITAQDAIQPAEEMIADPTAVSTNPDPTNTPLPASPTATVTNTPTATPTTTHTPTPTIMPTATMMPSPTATLLPPATATPSVRAISSLDATMPEEVTLRGQIVATASFSHGYRFTLDDGSGRITLLLWHNVYDDAWDAPQLNLGATVTVNGRTSLFNNELQIEPRFGSQVRVVAPGGPIGTPRAIGDLAQHMGELVVITGTIDRVAASSAGARLFVRDDSGEIAVFIWNNTLERIANNTALGEPGTAVRVHGWVQEFRSNREVVPVLPIDVVVLP
jgi:DNA/RNA endonuclease YhcR with UshA esterase domain